MSLSICDHCDRLYVLDRERHPDQRCTGCRRPLRRLSREETRTLAQSQQANENH